MKYWNLFYKNLLDIFGINFFKSVYYDFMNKNLKLVMIKFYIEGSVYDGY